MCKVNVSSEIGTLEAVILHSPGQEVEKMIPENVERALYSDILNLSVAKEEYQQFKDILDLHCKTYEVKELLAKILNQSRVKENLLSKICESENVPELKEYLSSLECDEIARQLIEGVDIKRNSLTKYLSNERYSLRPLHNFIFTRDASISLYNKVLIGKMANNVRERESVIMNAIFKYHPDFGVERHNPIAQNTEKDIQSVKIEGGDVLIVSENVLVIGTGVRTSTQGIDFIVDAIKKDRKEPFHILVQELPDTPESFIHLDMVFTLLDKDSCMVYEPLILSHDRYRTIHITIANGKVLSIENEPNLLKALQKQGFDFKPITCGGSDKWNQEREQWHSGANFLALAPGIIIGYDRNIHTIEELNKNGFSVIAAKDIINKKVSFPTEKSVITIAGAELARGGGGARCMSMPVRRKHVDL
jgi:arginine deiminase